jgi:hypothetical protein
MRRDLKPKHPPQGMGELFEVNPALASILSGLSSAVDAGECLSLT